MGDEAFFRRKVSSPFVSHGRSMLGLVDLDIEAVDLDIEAEDDFWGERATGEPCRVGGALLLVCARHLARLDEQLRSHFCLIGMGGNKLRG